MAKKKALKDVLKDRPSWKEDCLELYQNGASDVEIRANLNITIRIFGRWMKEEKIFRKTIKTGRTLSQAWWERHGRLNLHNKNFNSVLWYMNMKNRFGWRDNQDVNLDSKMTIRIISYGDNNSI